jgi:hypothetical protein
MIELANLSSIIGNIFGSGIAKASEGIFLRNGPHKYPDLLAQNSNATNIEIKVALGKNKPKGHLAKSGYYLICRYVLADRRDDFTQEKEGQRNMAWIWEIRLGRLDETDFNLSNTPGDSGKTAVVNASGMNKLQIIYCDLERCPYSTNSRVIREYKQLYQPRLNLL